MTFYETIKNSIDAIEKLVVIFSPLKSRWRNYHVHQHLHKIYSKEREQMSLGKNFREWLWKGFDSYREQFSEHGEKMETELGELKKLVRRQGIQQESLVRELSGKLDSLAATAGEEEEADRPDSLIELAESFFHLEAALVLPEIAHETRAALNIVWGKLEEVCKDSRLAIIRESGVPFDSRMHEALDRAPTGESPVIRSLAAPGFIHNGRVIRPARVMLAENTTAPITAQSEEMNGK